MGDQVNVRRVRNDKFEEYCNLFDIMGDLNMYINAGEVKNDKLEELYNLFDLINVTYEDI